MRRHWALKTVILLTLALGLGANVAIFSVVDGILFQPLPYSRSDRLLTPLNGYFPAGYYQGLRERDRTLDLAAYAGAAQVTLRLAGQPVQIAGSEVSADFIQVLGVAPALGRGFSPGANAPGQDGEAVLSDALWRSQFGARRDILGATVEIAGRIRAIVGVMPAAFRFPSAATQVWLPDRMDPANLKEYWSTYTLQILGRLRPNATLALARADFQQQSPAVAALFPYPVASNFASTYPLVPLRDALVGPLQTRFLLLLGAVGLVLLIACVNVVNLLLIGVAARRRELAVRMALGASRARIIRQLVGEALRLALLGGALGLLFAAWGVPLLVRVLPADTPHLAAAALHWRAAGFAFGLALLVGLATGLVPGWRAADVNLDAAMRPQADSAPSRQRLSAVLLVAEVAVAVVVIVAGALLAASMVQLSRASPGFDPEHVIAMGVAPADAYCASAPRCADFYRHLEARVAALPGVQSAGLVNALPLGGVVPIAPVIFDDHPLLPGAAVPLVWANLITPGYLRALRIPLLSGRAFSDSDSPAAAKVILVNRSLARRLWPGQSPLGKSVATLESGFTPWTVVGVVADVRELALSGDPDFFQGELYFPYAQALASPPVQGSLALMSLALRASHPPSASVLRRAITELDPDVPAAPERALSTLVYANLAAPRTTTGLFLLFGLLALALAAIGAYGVLSHNVAQRTREFGIRVALGATPASIVRLVLARGLAFAAAGIALGLAAAFALSRLLAQLLFQVSPADPLAYLAAATLVLAAAFCATAPAARHGRSDPLAALRHD